jgi:hypothetical protein
MRCLAGDDPTNGQAVKRANDANLWGCRQSQSLPTVTGGCETSRVSGRNGEVDSSRIRAHTSILCGPHAVSRVTTCALGIMQDRVANLTAVMGTQHRAALHE